MAGHPITPITLAGVVQVCREHYELLTADKTERAALNYTKKHFSWYLKSFPGAAHWRKAFMACEDLEQVEKLLDELTTSTATMDDVSVNSTRKAVTSA